MELTYYFSRVFLALQYLFAVTHTCKTESVTKSGSASKFCVGNHIAHGLGPRAPSNEPSMLDPFWPTLATRTSLLV